MAEEPHAVDRAWPLMRALVGVGLVCALLLVSVYELTRPLIEANRVDRLLRTAITVVLPDTRTVRSFRRHPDGSLERLDTPATGADVVHAGLDQAGQLIGFAFEGRGPGYQDTIELLLGYDPRRQRLLGFTVLASRETPGLGDRIGYDQQFLASFPDLELALDASGRRLARAVELARPGQPREPWQIDAITGATVSARAVARIVTATVESWAPALIAQLPAFEE